MAWDSDCASCYHFEADYDELKKKGTSRCSACGQHVPGNQRISDCPVYSKSNTDSKYSTFERDRIRRFAKDHGYYVVTAISEILGLGYSNKYLDVFEYLSDVVMRPSKEYDSFIEEYDELGPIAAKKLKAEEDAKELATYYVNYYLEPMYKAAAMQDNDRAIEEFMFLFKDIKERYNLKKKVQKVVKR